MRVAIAHVLTHAAYAKVAEMAAEDPDDPATPDLIAARDHLDRAAAILDRLHDSTTPPPPRAYGRPALRVAPDDKCEHCGDDPMPGPCPSCGMMAPTPPPYTPPADAEQWPDVDG